ncbi:sodium:solute symporter family transporter [Arthrobacter citreus]|uniref:sodium:solute symporter family transporter n=1 Tax=Arthrobacter citreus TaxID=1670 RepID=UPI0031F7DA2C
MNPMTGYAALAAVTAATLLIGVYGLRISRTTGISTWRPAPWAVVERFGHRRRIPFGGQLPGCCRVILVSGVDALWFPIGYTAGYLMLLLFVAAPLRRSGAYTIPDFAQARLGSLAARRITSLLVIAVGGCTSFRSCTGPR